MQFTISSACLVLNEQKEMLLKKDPIRGWEIPGGLVEANETFKEAAVREVYEETGIEIVIGSFCGISQEVNKGACHMWWLGQAVGGQLTTSAESEAVGFFSYQQAVTLISNESFKKELRACYQKEMHPFALFL